MSTIGDMRPTRPSAQTDVAETVHDGSLGDAGFVYRGVEYTVKRLTISSLSSFGAGIEIEDADAAALPDTAAVGIELQGSPTGETVLVDWRQRAEPAVEDRGRDTADRVARTPRGRYCRCASSTWTRRTCGARIWTTEQKRR